MTTADLFVQALENEGVEYIFGLPGEENLYLLEAIRKSDKIKFVLTRHEQGAGFMAATYGRLTGKPGVCLSTLGPGATNLVTPTAFAQLGAMPLVVITGQKPILKSKQGSFQIIDVVNMMRPLTKYTRQITNGEQTGSIIREAFRLAKEERPGAVHIELPEDIAEEQITEAHVFDVIPNYIPTAATASMARAEEMIRQAKQPLLLIGADANRKRTSMALTHFVNETGIPFFNTQLGKGIIDERHPLFLGTAALSEYDFLHDAIHHADLIINVGHDTIEKPPFFMSPDQTQKVIHINFFASSVDAVYFPHLSVIGDIATTVNTLTTNLADRNKTWDPSFFIQIRNNVRNRLATYAGDNRFPILPQRLTTIIRETLPEDGMLTLDNGMYKIWFARNYPAYYHNTLLLDNALATMGAGLPSAIMAKMVYPGRKVISISGDGGFLMNSQELETAVRLGVDLVVIILNDGAYGMIKWKQQGADLAHFGLEFSNPDFVSYAKSFGAQGYRPSSVQDFQDTLSTTLNSRGVHVIDLAVDYSLNHKILNVLLKERNNFNSKS